MEDPHSPVTFTVSLKAPETEKWAKDDPWIVISGTGLQAVKEAVAAVAGVEHEALTLADVTINSQRVLEGVQSASKGLGGRVLGFRKNSDEAPVQATANVVSINKNQPSAKEVILGEIEAQTSRSALKTLRVEKPIIGEDEELLAAWKAKGKSLPA